MANKPLPEIDPKPFLASLRYMARQRNFSCDRVDLSLSGQLEPMLAHGFIREISGSRVEMTDFAHSYLAQFNQ